MQITKKLQKTEEKDLIIRIKLGSQQNSKDNWHQEEGFLKNNTFGQ